MFRVSQCDVQIRTDLFPRYQETEKWYLSRPIFSCTLYVALTTRVPESPGSNY